MDQWIYEEEQKWREEIENYEKFLNSPTLKQGDLYVSSITKKLTEFLQKINMQMFSYYTSKFERTDELREAFKKKKILIKNSNQEFELRTMAFDYKINDDVINGGHRYGQVYLNPRSSLLLYNSYKQFLNGNLEGIRTNINYESIEMSDLSKSNLTRKELLYWCYIHKISFEKLCETTLIHECSHQYGLSEIEPDDPKISDYFMEGITEYKARKFSKDIGLDYIPIFHEKDFQLINQTMNLLMNNGFSECKDELVKFSLLENPDYFTKLVFSALGLELDDNFYNNVYSLDLYMQTYQANERMQMRNKFKEGTISFLDYFEIEERIDENLVISKMQELIEEMEHTK